MKNRPIASTGVKLINTKAERQQILYPSSSKNEEPGDNKATPCVLFLNVERTGQLLMASPPSLYYLLPCCIGPATVLRRPGNQRKKTEDNIGKKSPSQGGQVINRGS